jgi:NAD(P)H-dependent FMN reductase
MRDHATILGIAGSLRKDSYNRAALRAAQDLAPAGAAVEIFDLQGIPPFNIRQLPRNLVDGTRQLREPVVKT